MCKLKLSLLFFLVYFAFQCQAQEVENSDTTSYFLGLHRWEGSRFNQQENSIGLVPSIQGFQELYLGLALAKGWFRAGEGGGNAVISSLGVAYNPVQQVWAPNIRLCAHAWAFFLGINAGIQGIYYTNGTNQQFVLKPEIGIGLLKGFLNYGYHIPTKNDFVGIPRHSLTFSFYFTILPPKD
jgi:hypothetical protein